MKKTAELQTINETSLKYDFETLPDRTGTGSVKWDDMRRRNPDLSNDIIPFSVADMEFLNPPEISNGLAEFAKKAVLGYTLPTDRYYESVISWMKRRHGWDVKREWIVDFPGVVPALFRLVQCLTEPGEGIIIMSPVYYPFRLAAEASGRIITENVLTYSGAKYSIDFDDLEKKAKDPQNRMLILCSPHNPVGRVWTRGELMQVGDICQKNNVIVVSDEIHHDIIMPGNEHTCFASLSEEFAENSIICTAPSKSFNIAGMQISNIIIPDKAMRRRVKESKNEIALMECGIMSYESCILAYEKCEDWLDELIEVIDRNRIYVKNYIDDKIPEIDVIRMEGTYLQWLDCRSLGMEAKQMEQFMQEKAQLFFDEGYIFGTGGEGFERLNLACPRFALESALQRLERAVCSL